MREMEASSKAFTSVAARSAVALALVLFMASCSASQAGAPPRQLTFSQSGLAGGGFVNVIVADPNAPGTMLAGGDVSGFHRSTDGGQRWVTSNTGLDGLENLSVASIAFSSTQPGTVYAAVGVRGAGGGVVVSTDGGITWSLRSDVPQFSGSNNNGLAGLPQPHPRSTGDLLALDETNGLIYAATFSQGIMRSSDGGSTWQTLGLAGRYLRGLAFDPSQPDTLYVGVHNGGIYRTTTASTSGVFDKLVGSPATPEEMWLGGDGLYVAGGKGGVFRTLDGGSTWEQLGAGQIPTGAPSWMSIAGYRACDRDVLYAGAYNGGSNSIMRSLDGGATWSSLAAGPANVHTSVGGPTGEDWWLAAQPPMLLGGSFSAVSDVVVGLGPPEGPDCIQPQAFVSGRAGVWMSANAGTDWYPMVAGLGVTIARDVAADPSLVGRSYIGTADWVFHRSSDGLVHVTQDKPPVGTTAADIAIDPSSVPGRVYVATGNPSSNTNGKVYSSSDPFVSGWTDEGLSSKTGAKRPLGIAVGMVGGKRIILAAVENSGIWRKSGSTWTKVQAVAMAAGQPSRGASLLWPAGSSIAYLYDRVTGVWRSNNGGLSWSKIWASPSPDVMTGYLAVDPAEPGRLYVSVGSVGVYRIEGATTGSVGAGTLTPVEVGSFEHPGAIDTSPEGGVCVASLAAPGSAPGLFCSTDLGASWSLVSDAFYAAAAGFVFDIAIDPDGSVLVSTNGNGVIVGSPQG